MTAVWKFIPTDKGSVEVVLSNEGRHAAVDHA